MKRLLRLLKNIVINRWGASEWAMNQYRPYILRWGGINIEAPGQTLIYSNCYFQETNVSIGSGSFINTGCFFQSEGPIVIGRNCGIAMQVMFSTPTHEIGDSKCRTGKTLNKPIHVEDGCWIGTRAVILAGVTIGAGCIIAAGAVVNKDCQPNGLYAGVPARRLRDLPIEDQSEETARGQT